MVQSLGQVIHNSKTTSPNRKNFSFSNSSNSSNSQKIMISLGLIIVA